MDKEQKYRFYAWGKSFPINSVSKQIHKEVAKVATGQNHILMLTTQGQLYVRGSNKFGQLGIANNATSKSQLQNFQDEFVNVTTNPQFKSILGENCSIRIRQIACGAEHTFILNQKYELFSMGLNIKGQLGHGNFENCLKPKLVVSMLPFGMRNPKSLNPLLAKNTKPPIVQILEKFQLQVKMEDEPIQSILLLESEEYVEKISCGALFTIVLTNRGRVFGCGYQGINSSITSNKENQDYMNKSKFSEIKIQQLIKHIHCGLSGTAAVTKQNLVYVWGRFGKLQYNVPKRVNLIKNKQILSKRFEEDRFQSAQVGDEFIALLTTKGQLYTCGQNIDNQLGWNSEEAAFKAEFEKVQNVPLFKSIHVGRNHCFAVNGNNELYGWGSNKFNQIGVSQNLPMTVQPQFLGIVLSERYKIYPSSYYTLLLVENKIVFSNPPQSPAKTKQNQQQTVPLSDYKKLLHDYQVLKSLNLTLLQKNHPPKKINTAIQTASKFDADGLVSSTKFRQFQSNTEIEWAELELLDRLNEGGYGVIYKAKWREIIVVVKKFKIDNGDVSLRDFLSECNAMEAVRHPYIVMFLGAVTKPKNYSIVLEYCKKGSLWSYLQNAENNILWQQRKRLATEIAQGVLYLHECRPPILHRDLKSLNIFLDEHSRIKIGDFGWTKTLDEYMTNKIGTYQWMAPEVIGNKPYTQKADVFSYSIILWEIASRQPPYRNISGAKVSQAVAKNQLRPNIPKKTPEPFAKLMKKCWDHDPSKRPTFKEIIRQLEIMKL